MKFNFFNFIRALTGWRLVCFSCTMILSIIVLYQAILTFFFTYKINAFILLCEYILLLCSTSFSIFRY